MSTRVKLITFYDPEKIPMALAMEQEGVPAAAPNHLLD